MSCPGRWGVTASVQEVSGCDPWGDDDGGTGICLGFWDEWCQAMMSHRHLPVLVEKLISC